MFWRDKSVHNPEALIVTEKPRPQIPHCEMSEEEFTRYEAMVTALGVDNGAFTHLRLTRFFEQHLIPVYPYEAVDRYLVAEAQARLGAKGTWWWEALRPSDCSREYPLTLHVSRKGGAFQPYYGQLHRTVYHKAIPVRVLDRAHFVATAFPTVTLWVSEIGSPSVCPFLGVTARGIPMLVIDQWDEPAFGFPVL